MVMYMNVYGNVMFSNPLHILLISEFQEKQCHFVAFKADNKSCFIEMNLHCDTCILQMLVNNLVLTHIKCFQ